jgi:hypothetical protein
MPVRWIIVDTLSRAIAGGDENGPKDMSALVGGADCVRNETGAHISFIHHPGKDGTKGARGHSSLLGAIDTEIEIKRIDGTRDAFSVMMTKQRELDYGPPLTFRRVVVPLGTTNKWGKSVTSCIVREEMIKPGLNELEQAATGILRTMLFDNEATAVKLTAWREAVFSGPLAETKDRKQWKRLKDGLEEKKAIEISLRWQKDL